MTDLDRMVMHEMALRQLDATMHLWQALAGALLHTGALDPSVLRAVLVHCANQVPNESLSMGLLIRARQELDQAVNESSKTGRPTWLRGVIDGGKDGGGHTG